ncbi:MAG: type II toxin-antitoxin system RelE family toxin [Natronosporangium sp.]
MAYTIELRPSARKQFLALDKQTRARVAAAIDALADNPRPSQVVKVKNADEWRVRVGNYRFTYTVDDARRAITVAWVGHRRDAYRDLR